MTDLDKRIVELKKLLSFLYLQGDKRGALKVSQQLDALIVKAQRMAVLRSVDADREPADGSAAGAI